MAQKKLSKNEKLSNLMKELSITNPLAVPRITKIKVSAGIGSYINAYKDYAPVIQNITQITAQKPIITKAKKAISNFKLRAGMPMGICATLRGKRMQNFLTKLINAVLPRIRDFRGLSITSFDGHGNYNIGIKEYTVFPEIKIEDMVKNHGMQVTVVTNAKTNEQGLALLKTLGFPFK